MIAHSSVATQTAAGLRGLRSGKAFAATQAAWRFYSNPQITLPQLCAPLVEVVRAASADSAENLLVALDWSRLDYSAHVSKKDRIVLQNRHDLGYKLLSALALSDKSGAPLAPLCLELKARDGVHSTRDNRVFPALPPLDGLTPVMAHLEAQQWGRRLVYIVDREGDSVAHFRDWDAKGWTFLVRARVGPRVKHAGLSKSLKQVASDMKLRFARQVRYHGKEAWQYVGESTVLLERPASRHRVVRGKRRKKLIPGAPLELRLVVSEIRDATGNVLAQWLLLTNLSAGVDAAKVALWYYWRWRIESYHKLLKTAGQQVERWLQDDAASLMRRLLVSAMACVTVWQLAREETPEADAMRKLLVRLSGRLMKRGKDRREFTEPALLAGIGVLIPMLLLLEETSLDEVRRLAQSVLPAKWLGTKSG